MASVERGRLRVRWTDRQGRKQSQTFPAGTPKRVVEDFERKAKLQLILPKEKQPKRCPTLREYAERFLTVYPTMSPRQVSTTKKDRSTLKCHLLPVFGDWPITDIKPRHVIDLQSTLIATGEDDDGYEPQSVRNVVSCLSTIMKLAVIEQEVEYNPCASVPRVARTWKEPPYWSFTDKDTFLCAAQERDPELFQLAAFACDTGARIGELEGLLGDCVNLQDGWVEYRRTFCTKERRIKDRTKNDLPRRVYLSPEIVRVMASKRRVGTEERIFPLNFNLLSLDRLSPLCEKAEVRRLTPHGWRHTFASHLLMLGKPPKDVQEALGHKKIATTLDTYGHLLEEYKRGTTTGMNQKMRWVRTVETKIVPLFGR